MEAAATLNSSIIAMPALAPGRAWVARVAARMSASTVHSTVAVSRRSVRPQNNNGMAMDR